MGLGFESYAHYRERMDALKPYDRYSEMTEYDRWNYDLDDPNAHDPDWYEKNQKAAGHNFEQPDTCNCSICMMEQEYQAKKAREEAEQAAFMAKWEEENRIYQAALAAWGEKPHDKHANRCYCKGCIEPF